LPDRSHSAVIGVPILHAGESAGSGGFTGAILAGGTTADLIL
jgi:hypothetical protein